LKPKVVKEARERDQEDWQKGMPTGRVILTIKRGNGWLSRARLGQLGGDAGFQTTLSKGVGGGE